MSVPAPAEIRERLIGPGGAFELVEESVRGHSMRVFKQRTRSLRELLERTERFGDRLYLVDGDVRLTFREHLEQVERAANALRDRHAIRPGDRVALFAANRWEWIVAFWATSWLGAIPCLMNGWWTAEEFADAVAVVEPALIVGDAPRLERVKPMLKGLRTLGMDDFGDLLRGSTALAGAAPVTCEDDPAFLIFTSGTTGRAKAVSVPHRAACGFSQVSGFSEAYGRGLFGVPLPAAGVPAPPSDDVVLVTSPLLHVSMLYGAVVMGAVKGFRMVLLPGRFEPERVLQAIERERVTLWMALGSAAPRVVGCPALRDYDTSSLRQVGIGGAPVSPTLQESLRSAFPSTGRLLGMGYTSTEAGAVIASIGGPEFERHPTSTGRVSLTVEVELRDAAGQPVAAGEEGEVHVRSPYLMLGYWNDAKATASAQKAGGWLAMGDVARFEEGLLYINARARDMLLVSAENVSPTEIEYCLEAHPRVLEAAAVGVDDPLTGDAVCAFVVVDPANRPETSELEDWCRRSLAHYKVPSVWLLTHDPLPRTPSGKVIKSEVRARIEAHYRRGR